MTDTDLQRFLARPELARLWALARERIERLGRVGGTVRLDGAGEDERRAVADLLGLATLPGADVRVELRRLDRALQESRFAVGLANALEALGGPLRDLPAARAAERHRRELVWSRAARHPALERHPELAGWLEELRREGLLRRLAAATTREPAGPAGSDPPRGGASTGERHPEGLLLEGALRVLTELPRPRTEPVPLGVLARDVLGSSHALDAGRPVATLVLRGLAHLHDRPPPGGAAGRRGLWLEAGVLLDELSSHVLVLGLSPDGAGPVARALRALSATGEPARLTLRQVDRLADGGPGAWGRPEGAPPVHVCENPVVVAAAADRWGPACPPLVCLEGVPSQAARELLAALGEAGHPLRYHGDFDWPGLRIAAGVSEVVPFEPWRFGADDYRRAAAVHPGGPRLAGSPAEAPWDPELPRAMAEAGVVVEEEAVLDQLLDDLAPRRPL